MNKASADNPPGRALAAGLRGVWPGMVALVVPLAGCAQQPVASPKPLPTARALAFQAAHVLLPYSDPLHTYELRRPQTWVVLDRRNTPEFGGAG